MLNELAKMLLWLIFLSALIAFVLGFVTSCACGAPPCYVPIRVTTVTDGDTLRADVHLPFDVTLREQRIRVRDFDAWEVSKTRNIEISDAEIAKGLKARDDLAKLLRESDGVYIEGEPRARYTYERLLAHLYVDRGGELVNVAEWMRNKGHERK